LCKDIAFIYNCLENIKTFYCALFNTSCRSGSRM